MLVPLGKVHILKVRVLDELGDVGLVLLSTAAAAAVAAPTPRPLPTAGQFHRQLEAGRQLVPRRNTQCDCLGDKVTSSVVGPE